ETVHEEKGDRVEKAATTASSLEAEQDSGTINRTQSTVIPNEPIPYGIGSGVRPSAPVTAAGVSISTAEPSTPPTTITTLIEDEDLTITQTLMKTRSVKSKEKSKEKGVSSTRLTRGVIMKDVS
nr:hypothetical protein [Tanacetum cinerariifolium]